MDLRPFRKPLWERCSRNTFPNDSRLCPFDMILQSVQLTAELMLLCVSCLFESPHNPQVISWMERCLHTTATQSKPGRIHQCIEEPVFQLVPPYWDRFDMVANESTRASLQLLYSLMKHLTGPHNPSCIRGNETYGYRIDILKTIIITE